jgi:hypothetical protein
MVVRFTSTYTQSVPYTIQNDVTSGIIILDAIIILVSLRLEAIIFSHTIVNLSNQTLNKLEFCLNGTLKKVKLKVGVNRTIIFASSQRDCNFTLFSGLTTHSKNRATWPLSPWLKGKVRENLGDFRKSIQILTFLSPYCMFPYLSQKWTMILKGCN